MLIRSAAVVALVAGSSSAALGARPHALMTAASPLASITFNGSSNPTSWVRAQPLPGILQAQLGPALTSTTDNVGIAVAAANGSNLLNFAVATSGSWSPWTGFGAGITTRARPALASDSARAHLAFHGTDFKHYYNRYAGVSWQGVELVGGTAASQSFGPTAASIAAIGENAYIVYCDGGNSNRVSMRIRQWAGEGNPPVWSPTLQVSAVAPNFNISPAVAAADQPLPAVGGAVEPWDLMVAFLRTGDNAVMFTRRLTNPSGGGGPAFESAAQVPSAFTAGEVSLVGLEQGRAILAFRGNDGNLYFSQWGNGGNTWSTVTQVFTNEQINSAPVLARGFDATGLGAQIAWITPSGTLGHARWDSSAWVDRQVINTLSLLSAPLTNAALSRAGTVADASVVTSALPTATADSNWSATFEVRNAGPDASSSSDLTITIPAGLAYQSVTLPLVGGSPAWVITSAPAVGSAGTLLLSSATGVAIPRGQQQNIVLNLSVDAAATGTLNVGYGLVSIIPDAITGNQAGSVSVTVTPAVCPADCDASGGLSPADFTCFLGKYRAGDTSADCDASGGLSPADFTCFLAKYRAGCS